MKNNVPKDPSLTVGSILPVGHESMDKVIDQVLPLFELGEPEAAVAGFIEERTSKLSETSDRTEITPDSHGKDGFIDSETDLGGSLLFSRPYRMDDLKAYEASFPHIKAHYSNIKQQAGDMPQEKVYLNAVLRGANRGQIDYFESVVGDLRQRATLMGDILDDDRPDIASIADYKGAAQCQERAAVAHNTLLIFGVESRYEVGRLSSIDREGQESSESHAFLTVTGTDGTAYIFDPTNPHVVRDEEGTIVDIRPAVYKLDLDESQTQQVQRRDYLLKDGKTELVSSQELTYSYGAPRKLSLAAGHIAVTNTT